MSEENPDPQPATTPTVAPETPETAEAAAAPEKKRRFAGSAERLRGTRALVAATLAALIVGGVGGAAIHAAVDGDRHDRGPFFRGGPGEMRGDFGGRMGWVERPDGPGDFERYAPPGFPAPVPPTTSPEDEDDEASPTPSPSESSSS